MLIKAALLPCSIFCYSILIQFRLESGSAKAKSYGSYGSHCEKPRFLSNCDRMIILLYSVIYSYRVPCVL
jgi:hypothetical protein